ncbi:hypothetical protein SPAN111604_04175 [Sphingomonas antarctica]|uniref:ribonuclease n=1 Tax=Sphingomonas antarctica TaxID=2040274 RepID=UPI0039EC7AEC
MAAWLVEETPEVDRAILIDGDRILAAHIALKGDDHPRLGAVLAARWHSPQRVNAGERPAAAILIDEHDNQLYLPRPPAGAGPGTRLTVEVVREAVWTPRSHKLAKVRVTDAAAAAVPSLPAILAAPILSPYQPDALEAAGWTELLEEAELGRVDGDGVRLWLDATEAMTLIDIDGTLPPEDLAVAGATLVARTIRRLDIGGSIGIDFPTVASKSARLAAADAFDAAMTDAFASPFERTAINGYGFMQVIRPLLRPSIMAIMRSRHAQHEHARRTHRAEYDGYLSAMPRR